MMAALNVTALKDLGYDEKTSFIDPMDPKYRAKSFNAEDLANRKGDFSIDAIEAKCKQFQDMDAYKKVNEVEQKLEEYWATKKTQTTLQTSVSSSSGSSSVPVVVASSTSKAASVASSAGSTLVTSTSSAKSSSTTKSDDKGGKKTTTTSSAVKTTTKRK